MSASRDLYLATKNAGKLEEFQGLLRDSPYRLRTDPAYQDPVEGAESYRDNAALKASALREQLRARGVLADVLADDSGLEVAALDGRPGVVTAEYGGPGLTWAERRRVLLDELAASGATDRGARFVCYLHLIAADGRVATAFAAVDGSITPDDRGAAGFSFDPIFAYGPDGRTFAELSLPEKNRVSHRARAVARLLTEISA